MNGTQDPLSLFYSPFFFSPPPPSSFFFLFVPTGLSYLFLPPFPSRLAWRGSEKGAKEGPSSSSSTTFLRLYSSSQTLDLPPGCVVLGRGGGGNGGRGYRVGGEGGEEEEDPSSTPRYLFPFPPPVWLWRPPLLHPFPLSGRLFFLPPSRIQWAFEEVHLGLPFPQWILVLPRYCLIVVQPSGSLFFAFSEEANYLSFANLGILFGKKVLF